MKTMKPDRKPARRPAAELQSYMSKVAPGPQRLFRAVRAVFRKRLPSANELAYDYGKFFVVSYSPTEQGIESILSIAARPDGLRLYFSNGPTLPDPKRILQGSGKQARYVEVNAVSDLKRPEVEALIAAVIDLAIAKMPATKSGALMIKGRGAKPSRRPASKKKKGPSGKRA
jgi:hypothetical protein